MSWEPDLPDGVSDFRKTGAAFHAAVSIPPDEDGYIGRLCKGCESMFRMRADEYNPLPDSAVLTCPYCGRAGDSSDFMTEGQKERVMAAAGEIGLQYVHDELSEMLKRTFGSSGRSRLSGGSGISIEFKPGPRPRARTLPEIVEEKVLRAIECHGCQNHYAVSGTSAFCPVCGPRAASENVLDSIAAGRRALALEDHLPENERDAARAAGVFDRLAADTLKTVVTIFEVFARDQFTSRAANSLALKGNVFERLDDTAKLFAQHCGVDLPATVGLAVWARLREDFARRHVLTHCDGIVDAKFLAAVPGSTLTIGQRLVVGRADAERALDDVETVVQTLGLHP